ncbi:helix-turn-helix transcriptional regulator [Latilactobacillus sakei]|uniref:helix-turn-helix transcriptional regulator n=1 Tax=Latilactobacillus sakei TaxID=1599 RepID=UPI000DC641A2|nr:helix-turn-helix transcriptional regulator [Latilactobacillus sakei]SPS07292.1 hypothetical protein LAS9624_01543 [Latilactobacillus sakei]
MTNNIRKLRLEQNVSQTDLAKSLNISRQAISNYEKGLREPRLEAWKKLADYFDVPVSYLQGVDGVHINDLIKSLWVLWSTAYENTIQYFSDYTNFIGKKSSKLEQLEDLDDLGDMPETPPSDFIKIIDPLLDIIIRNLSDENIDLYNIYNEYYATLEPNRDTDTLYNAFTYTVSKIVDKEKNDKFKKTFAEFNEWETKLGYMNLISSVTKYFETLEGYSHLMIGETQDEQSIIRKQQALDEIDATIKMLESTKEIIKKGQRK